MKTLSIIAPCFNEENNIKNFYNRLTSVIKKMKIEYTIHFIDDGSSDTTWKVIRDLKKKR